MNNGITREQVWSALFALFTPLQPGTFITVSRRLDTPQDSTPAIPEEQPALYQVEGNETTEQVRGLPPKHILHGSIWVFAKIPDGARSGTPDYETPGATVLNPLLDAIESAMAPDVMPNALTLGGLVSHCWIEGETIKVIGDLNPDGQCYLAIPVHILVP